MSNSTFSTSTATTSTTKNVVTITKLAYSKMDTPSLLRRYNNPKQVDDLNLIVAILTKRGKMPLTESQINSIEDYRSMAAAYNESIENESTENVEIKQSDIDFTEIMSTAAVATSVAENISIDNELPVVIVAKKSSKKAAKNVEVDSVNSTMILTDEKIKFQKLNVAECDGFVLNEVVTFTNKVTRYGIEKGTPIEAKILYFRQKTINGKLYAKLQYEENGSTVIMMKVLNSVSKIVQK